MDKLILEDIACQKNGFLRGPFGGDLKKEIFVSKGNDTYKVYEQGVVLESNSSIGNYYITQDYYDKKMFKFSVKDGDFLVSCSGVNMGTLYQLKKPFEKGIINQALLRIRLNKEIIDANYFYYLFKIYISKRITKGTGDSTIPNFPPMDYIKKIEIYLPDKIVQKKIGQILFVIDKKINLNKKINAKLEQMAKALYNYWFVQFDFPNEEGKPYKTFGGEMIYNEELKRVIPRDWLVAPLSKFTNKNAIPCKDDEYKDCEIIDLSIMHSNSISINNRTSSGTFNTNLFRMKKYDILFGSIRAYLGKAGIAPFDGAVNGTIHSYLPKKEYKYSFLVCSLINKTMFKYAIFHSKGTKMPVIESDELLKYKLPYSKEVSILFNKKVFTFWKKIILNVEQNHELIQIRDFLLPLLMNGQVKVN